MKILRFCPMFSDEWTQVTARGPDAADALSILAARLESRGDEVELIEEAFDETTS